MLFLFEVLSVLGASIPFLLVFLIFWPKIADHRKNRVQWNQLERKRRAFALGSAFAVFIAINIVGFIISHRPDPAVGRPRSTAALGLIPFFLVSFISVLVTYPLALRIGQWLARRSRQR